MTSEIRKEMYCLEELLCCTVERAYTITNEIPRITNVITKVNNFLKKL